MGGEHYFSSHPTPGSRPQLLHLTLPDLRLSLLSDSGVFAAERIDAGSTVLLRHGPRPPAAGNLLDLGCGYGTIAVTLGRRSPAATVYAIDVNQRAVGLCQENANRNGALNVLAMAPGDIPDALRFDAIYCNPPIRIGRGALLPLLQTWLSRLNTAGYAALVVHRHLGADSLAQRLRELGFVVNRLSSHRGYRILEIKSADSSPDPGEKSHD